MTADPDRPSYRDLWQSESDARANYQIENVKLRERLAAAERVVEAAREMENIWIFSIHADYPEQRAIFERGLAERRRYEKAYSSVRTVPCPCCDGSGTHSSLAPDVCAVCGGGGVTREATDLNSEKQREETNG